MDESDETPIIRNIPASVLSDINRIDEAITSVGNMADSADYGLTWEDAEVILDALHDARSALLYLADKHDKLAVKLQEYES